MIWISVNLFPAVVIKNNFICKTVRIMKKAYQFNHHIAWTIRNHIAKVAEYNNKDNSHSPDVNNNTQSTPELNLFFYEQYGVISCVATDLNNDKHDKYWFRNATKQ